MNYSRRALISYVLPWLFIIVSGASYAQQIYVNPGQVNASVGTSFAVDVMVRDATSLSAFEFGVSFDKDILQAVSVDKGSLWDNPDYPWHAGEINNLSGRIGFTSGAAFSGLGPGEVSVDADGGALARITFQVITEGASPLDLDSALICSVSGDIAGVDVTDGIVTTDSVWNLTLSEGWNMASCPGDPVISDVATLVKDTPVLPYVYTWNSDTQTYDQADTLQFGLCYWFAATQNTQLAIQYQPRAIAIYQVEEGWNMIGSVSGNVPVSSLTSNPASVVLPYVYGWNAATGTYDIVDTIVPGGGYWVAVTADAELTLNSTQIPTAPPAHVNSDVKATKAGWESVIAVQTQSQHQQLTFGMHSSASEGFDRSLDKPEPPPPAQVNKAIKAGWLIADANFSLLNGSFVGDGSHASWELSVELSEPGELGWSHLPTAYRCVLQYDGQMVQMQDGEYIYLPEGNHTFTLVLDAFASLPSQTQLLANYPNPFNPETWIPYRLSEAGDVTLTIYDMAGREVRQLRLYNQLSGEYQDKEHAIHWDGRNKVGEAVSSGIYFYSLQTAGGSQTRKLVVIR